MTPGLTRLVGLRHTDFFELGICDDEPRCAGFEVEFDAPDDLSVRSYKIEVLMYGHHSHGIRFICGSAERIS